MLRDQEEAADTPEGDLPNHLKPPRPPRTPNPDNVPYDFERTERLYTDSPVEPKKLPPDELIGRSFLMPPDDDPNERLRATIMGRIQEMRREAAKDPAMVKFKCVVNRDYEEVVAYNDVVDYIERTDNWDGAFKFNRILAHKNMKPGDPGYRQSMYNILVEWNTGPNTWEPLTAHDRKGPLYDDPV